MMVHPLFDRVLVKPVEEESTTSAGLHIPDVARNTSIFGYGEVVGIGPGRHDAQGALVKVKLKVGDVVMYPRKAAMKVPIPTGQGEIEFLLFREPDIFARVTELPKQTSILDADGRKVMAMIPQSLGRPDVVYENTEKTEVARRQGWLDINADGSDDHVDEETH